MNINIKKLKDGKIQPHLISEELFSDVVCVIEREVYAVGSAVHDTQERIEESKVILIDYNMGDDAINAKYAAENCAYVRFKEACYEIGLEPPYDNFFAENFQGDWVETFKAWLIANRF